RMADFWVIRSSRFFVLVLVRFTADLILGIWFTSLGFVKVARFACTTLNSNTQKGEKQERSRLEIMFVPPLIPSLHESVSPVLGAVGNKGLPFYSRSIPPHALVEMGVGLVILEMFF